MKPKELVNAYFKSVKTARPPFLPYYTKYAAKLEQISLEEMVSDSSTLVNSLLNAREVLNCDWIVYGPDFTLEAEALGLNVTWDEPNEFPKIEPGVCENLNFDIEIIKNNGRLAIVIETLKRIVKVHSQKIPVACTITGPWSLALLLTGKKELDISSQQDLMILNNCCNLINSLTRMYCENKVNYVVINETDLPSEDVTRQILTNNMGSIKKICAFYRVGLLFMTNSILSSERFESLLNGGVTGVITKMEALLNLQQLTEQKSFIGFDFSSEILNDDHDVDDVIHILRKHYDHFFMSGDIPTALSIEEIILKRELLTVVV